ncbi:hypothetical protein [Psychromonas aquimarina]|uniref:hypothetical protein n=1 Tax=Psychromonas aquimarina TaxID=444919 RepID=UPI0003FDFB2C|nr:hypothetical protein [Psychromonas aquimarina]
MKIIHVPNPEQAAHLAAKIISFNTGWPIYVEKNDTLPVWHLTKHCGKILAKFFVEENDWKHLSSSAACFHSLPSC